VRGVSQRLIIGLSVLVAIVCPVVSHAQEDQRLRDRDPDLAAAKKVASDLQQANFHNGSWYLLSRFRIADAGYTEAAYVPTGDQSGGISLSVEAPQRLYFVPRRKMVVSVEAIPGYSFLTEGNQRGQFNYSARGDLHFLLNHLYLDVYAAGANQLRAHIADINRLATVRESETGIAGEVKYSSRTSGVFTVRLRKSDYPQNRFQPDLGNNPDFNPIELLNRREKNARFSVFHKTFPLTSLFASTEVSKYDFTTAHTRNSTRTWVGGGFLYDSGRTQVRLEAGPVRLNFRDPLQHDHSGVTGNLRGSLAQGRRTWTAGVERDLGFSIFADNNFFVADRANAGLSYNATRKLTLRVNTAAERDHYETVVRGLERRDDITFSSVGFTYAFRKLTTGLDVGWYTRESTYGGDTDSGIRYILHLSFTP
jgi:hypothetical protein